MNDLRFALRQLGRTPGFTILGIGTLALGIGACTAMFSIVHAVLLKPLPFHEPERLVWIENNGTGGLSARTSRADVLRAWRERSQAFESLAAYNAFFDYERLVLGGSGTPELLRGVGVSDNFIPTLGISLLHGRNFTAEECASLDSPGAALLSHACWQRRFNGDPAVVGTSITLNSRSVTIVGVLPRSFDFDAVFAPGREVALLTPLPLNEQTARWGNIVFGIGRLTRGVSIDAARAEFSAITPQIGEDLNRGPGLGFNMSPLDEALRSRFRSGFAILTGAVACLLAIACVNLSNLLLARANARQQEFAVRNALGARRRHLIQQTLTESLLLAAAGSALGVVLAAWITSALARLQTFSIPLLQDATVSPVALAVSVVLTLLVGIACGGLPALYAARTSQSANLAGGSQQRSAGRVAVSARNTLVVTQVALACVLLVGAGLLIRSFVAVMSVNLGFQPAQAVAWRISPPRGFHLAAANQYYDGLAQRIAAVPGVEATGLTDSLPMGRNRSWGAAARGVDYPRGHYPEAFPRMVDRGYLQAMQIPLRAGRYFDTGDTLGSQRVVIINETMGRTLWPVENAVGKYLVVGGRNGTEHLVVGVAADVRQIRIEEAPLPEMYLSYHQDGDWNAIELVVRSPRELAPLVADVRTAIRDYDPALPADEYQPLDQMVADAVAPRRLFTSILTSFSSLALLLAALGIYGVIAYSVTQRTQEIGIRMAIGAHRGHVLRLVLRSGLGLVGIGVALGLAGAAALSRVLQSQLFGVTAHDPVVFAGIAVLLIAVAVLACLLPALRATRINPVQALRSE